MKKEEILFFSKMREDHEGVMIGISPLKKTSL